MAWPLSRRLPRWLRRNPSFFGTCTDRVTSDSTSFASKRPQAVLIRWRIRLELGHPS